MARLARFATLPRLANVAIFERLTTSVRLARLARLAMLVR